MSNIEPSFTLHTNTPHVNAWVIAQLKPQEERIRLTGRKVSMMRYLGPDNWYVASTALPQTFKDSQIHKWCYLPNLGED